MKKDAALKAHKLIDQLKEAGIDMDMIYERQVH